MKEYFIIYPGSIAGYSIVSSGEYNSYPSGVFPKGAVVMEIDSLDYHKSLFSTSATGHYFVTASFKTILEKANFSGVSFRPLDFLIIGLNLKDNYPNHGFTKSSFWKLELGYNKDADFYLFRGSLVVSDNALKFLYEHGAFEDRIEGSIYGKEYEILTNKFLLEGEVEDFVINKLPLTTAHIKKMRRKIVNEGRRRRGLTPLP